MILKVKVNLPEHIDELENIAVETMTKILVNKLQPKEIEQLIYILKDENTNIGW